MSSRLNPAQLRRVAIVGGGISGLAAAFRLRELDPGLAVTIYEASDRLGGVLQTAKSSGRLVEQSADSFISNVPWGVDLCRRLGMEPELISTNESDRKAFIVHRGKLHAVPAGFLLMAPSRIWPILTSRLLSPWGKLRLLAERLIPARQGNADESLGAFVRRRFGREAFERLVQPLVGGIYTADPEKLSLAATMPRFIDMERQHGSLIRAARKGSDGGLPDGGPTTSGARYGMFVAPRGGMSSLVERLSAQLPRETIRLKTTITALHRTSEDAWELTTAPGSSQPERFEHDAVILAIPAFAAARLTREFDASLADDLDSIPYAGIAIVALVYRRADIGHPLDGFGFVVPAIEKREILAASFASNKFPGRTSNDEVLIRVFIGGACNPELADLPDDQLRAIATRELADLLAIRGEPISAEVFRWPRSMPQYHLGHLALVARIESRIKEHPGLALAGNAYHGVGVPSCIHSGEQAAESVIQSIAAREK